MYHVRAANMEDIHQIIDRGYIFDLNIDKSPKFFTLLKDESFLSFAFIHFEKEYSLIEYIDLDPLDYDEIDFFIKSLDYLLEQYKQKVFTRQEILNYTSRFDRDLYLLEIKCKGCCKNE